LLIALHGSGMDGGTMAWVTGLGRRGPAVGITVVFPDGWKGGWHPNRPPAGEPELDDAQFLCELTAHLEAFGAARSWPVFLTGISHGARYAEHVARHGLLPVAGLFLAAGTTLEVSRRQMPVPQLRAGVIIVMGTGDRTTPYEGGRLTRSGLSGFRLQRRAAKHGECAGEDVVAGAEAVATDWAIANGVTSPPVIEELAMPAAANLPVTRKTWATPGCHPATLYRIDGGGHGWPGGPQLPPTRVPGPITNHLDATGLLLEMALWESTIPFGRPVFDGGFELRH
jgi:polyhydroxybutyrate depolymerase